MSRFTIRDLLWLLISVIVSLGVAITAFRSGAKFGRVGNQFELIESQYQLGLARACLKKHGLPFRCDE